MSTNQKSTKILLTSIMTIYVITTDRNKTKVANLHQNDKSFAMTRITSRLDFITKYLNY